MRFQLLIRRRKIIFSLLAVMIFLVILETIIGSFLPENVHRDILLRQYPLNPLVFSKLFEPDPLLFWRLRPHADYEQEGICINSKGLRGDEFSREKKAKTFRIVCMGDSNTFGFRVRDAETYPSILQSLLTPNLSVEVINAGVPGYSSLQGLRQLQRDVLPLDPDLLVVSFGTNDVLDMPHLRDSQQKTFSPFFFKFRNWLWQRNTTLLFAQIFAANEKQKPLLVTRCSPDESKKNLRDIYALALAQGIHVVFFHPLHESSPEKKLKNFSIPNGLPQLDIARHIDEAEQERGVSLFYNDQTHLTAEGYKVMTEAIADSLRRMKLTNIE